jgi:S1-C subfamily serine protease
MRRLILLCLLSALVGGLVAFGWHGSPLTVAQGPGPEGPAWPGQAPPAGRQPAAPAAGGPIPQDSLTPDEQVNIFVYQQANRAVVNINTKGVSAGPLPMLEFVSEGEGSGIVIDRAGHVLTNFHVVDGAREIHVTLSDGKTYVARPVGGDLDTDVAVLKIDAPAESLFPVVFGNSSNLLVGQRVFAIGNPFGLERTLSTGVISSLDRSLPSKRGRRIIKSVIQIDASINPGNSGGPLLDSHARMIGMNMAILSKTGESVGVGFAIPINTIARVVPLLIRDGRIRRAESGIARVYQTDRGLLIAALVPGGTAERAGLQGPRIREEQKRQGPFVFKQTIIDRSAADLIVAVDGQPIKTAEDFLNAVEAKQPGDEVVLTVIRAGQQQQIPLRLEASQ